MDWILPEPDRHGPGCCVRARVPAGYAAYDRRTLGDPDHAANRDFGAACLRMFRTDRAGGAKKPEPHAQSRFTSPRARTGTTSPRARTGTTSPRARTGTNTRIHEPVRLPGTAK